MVIESRSASNESMLLVNGCGVVLAALLLPGLVAAQDLPSAARELAHKTAAFLGTHGSLVVTYRNRSSLPDSELASVRREFAAALPPSASGFTSAREGVLEFRITLSENASQFLLVEEARKDEESQTWISAWNRTAPAALPVSGITLDRKLVWEQDDPILDLTSWDTGMLVLSPSHLTLYQRQGAQWTPTHQVALSLPQPSPRDPRGRLRRNGTRIEVFLPGAACQGDVTVADPGQPLSLICRPGTDPWVLESGSRALLLAGFAADRNYFDGRVVLQDGSHKTVPPFYSAAAAEDAGGTLWLLARVDGQTQIVTLTPAGTDSQAFALPAWGSDIVGVTGPCGGGAQVLASRPVDGAQPDALQAFLVGNRAALPASAPMPFEGAITALWPASPSAALAVVRDPADRKYRAYVVTLDCGS
jgi:hypothetical protein